MTTAAATAESSPSAKRHRTGAGARFNADHIGVYRAVNIGVLISAVAAVLISWQGLVYVADWMELGPQWRWLLPLMVDVPIVVFTLATLSRKARGEGILFLSLVAYGLTAVSAGANFLHVAAVRPLDTMEGAVGASLAALAPMLVLLTTEALGLLATKPPTSERLAKKRAREADAAELKELRKKLRAAEKELALRPAEQPAPARLPSGGKPAASRLQLGGSLPESSDAHLRPSAAAMAASRPH